MFNVQRLPSECNYFNLVFFFLYCSRGVLLLQIVCNVIFSFAVFLLKMLQQTCPWVTKLVQIKSTNLLNTTLCHQGCIQIFKKSSDTGQNPSNLIKHLELIATLPTVYDSNQWCRLGKNNRTNSVSLKSKHCYSVCFSWPLSAAGQCHWDPSAIKINLNKSAFSN